MNDEKVIKIDIEFLHQQANRLTAQVHIGLRLGYHYFIIGYFTAANSGSALLFIKAYTVFLGKMIQAHKADIMAIISVKSPGIA